MTVWLIYLEDSEVLQLQLRKKLPLREVLDRYLAVLALMLLPPKNQLLMPLRPQPSCKQLPLRPKPPPTHSPASRPLTSLVSVAQANPTSSQNCLAPAWSRPRMKSTES